MSNFRTGWWGRYGVEWEAMRNLAVEATSMVQEWSTRNPVTPTQTAIYKGLPYLGQFLFDLVEVVRQVSHDESTSRGNTQTHTMGTRLSESEAKMVNLEYREAAMTALLNDYIKRVDEANRTIFELAGNNTDLFLRVQDLERRFDSELSPRLATEHSETLLGTSARV